MCNVTHCTFLHWIPYFDKIYISWSQISSYMFHKCPDLTSQQRYLHMENSQSSHSLSSVRKSPQCYTWIENSQSLNSLIAICSRLLLFSALNSLLSVIYLKSELLWQLLQQEGSNTPRLLKRQSPCAEPMFLSHLPSLAWCWLQSH